jgi:hypothetical protein
MLEQIRLALRLANEEFDGEIEALIAACKADLRIAGIVGINDDDPLILQAVTLYCKGHFGFADIGEKYLNDYERLKTPLRLAGVLTGGDTP